MNRHIAAIAVILSGAVDTLSCTHAIAQVANPWDPFASQQNRPAKTAKKPRVRKDLPPPDKPVAATNDANQATAKPEEADSRPFLRSMEGATSIANSPPNSLDQPPSGQPGNRPNARANAATFDTAPASSTSIERSQLAPVIASDGSGLPYELWRGLDLASIEKLLAALEIPPRSPAIHALWTRLITSRSTISNDPQTDLKFAALRARALYRSGLNDPSSDAIATQPAGTNPINSILHAVSQIVMSRKPEEGCRNVRTIDVNAVPDSLKPETILVFGYCAAISGNKAATEMTANIAREQGVDDPMSLAALDSAAQGTLEKLPAKGKLTGLAYRLLETVNLKPDTDLIKRAEPALLVTLSRDKRLAPAARASAAEAAMRINAISPKTLAAIYHEIAAAPHKSPRTPSNPPGTTGNIEHSGAPLARARQFDKLENEFTPFKKARLARSFLDNARRAGLYLPALQMVHATTDALHPVPEISWFAQTAIEIALAAKDHERARAWARFSSGLDQRATGKLDHWLALIDIADPDQTTPRGTSLKSVEAMALSGRFGSKQLHRLATVLDALAYHVPVSLWQAASSTPQPNDGHLPESGVLTRLQDAAKAKEFGRTVLLAMQALGPSGAEGAHMIALGDSIRALKRAGLERDARRLGFEALFASWPRANSQ